MIAPERSLARMLKSEQPMRGLRYQSTTTLLYSNLSEYGARKPGDSKTKLAAWKSRLDFYMQMVGACFSRPLWAMTAMTVGLMTSTRIASHDRR
jgi:hypothetical protein